MSVYRHKDSPYYHYDFQFKGNRFHGSTGIKSKREAEAVERQEKDRVRQHIERTGRAGTSLRIDDICDRYWLEIGQHHVGKDTTERDLARLIEYFGPDKLLTDIVDDDVAKLVAWRRGHRIKDHRKKIPKNAPQLPLVSNATVNRSTTEALKKLFTRAKKAWRIRFHHEPDWKQHLLKEPEERVRELMPEEGASLDATARDDYRDIMDFAHASGLRLRECLLRWSEVNWEAKQIIKKGKGEKKITVPITSRFREILWPLRGHHPEFVFTYVAKRTRKEKGLIKGERYPITYNGLKTEWKRHRKRSGIADFRFHDFRHDFATKLLRKTGNLKLTQKGLNHSNIKTTTKYAHVLDQDIAEAIEAMQEDSEKSRNFSRSAPKKLA
jgi:integrase